MTVPHGEKPMRVFMHKAVHFVLTAMMLFLAYMFSDEVPTFGTSKAYDAMASIMPEQDWAILCAAIGAVGLTSIFTLNWKIRTISAGVLAGGHFVIALLIFLGNRHAIGSGIFFGYGALGLALAYSTAHLGERISEDLDSTDLS